MGVNKITNTITFIGEADNLKIENALFKQSLAYCLVENTFQQRKQTRQTGIGLCEVRLDVSQETRWCDHFTASSY